MNPSRPYHYLWYKCRSAKQHFKEAIQAGIMKILDSVLAGTFFGEQLRLTRIIDGSVIMNWLDMN